MSLCMPGVLIEGGPRGLDDERACRRRAEGASLRGSSGALLELRTASTKLDIVAAEDRVRWTVNKSKSG